MPKCSGSSAREDEADQTLPLLWACDRGYFATHSMTLKSRHEDSNGIEQFAFFPQKPCICKGTNVNAPNHCSCGFLWTRDPIIAPGQK